MDEVELRVIWTWCPQCMDREDQEVLEGGELRCTKCGLVWRKEWLNLR